MTRIEFLYKNIKITKLINSVLSSNNTVKFLIYALKPVMQHSML